MIAALLLLQAAACTPQATAAATPAGWSAPVAATDGATLVPGRAATVTLVAGKALAVVPATAKAKAGAAGASLGFTVPRAGRWRVSLDTGAWVDVVRDGRAVASVGHGHGGPCSGVRKQVEFDLAPGRYDLQLSGAGGTSVRVMVAPA